MRAGFWEILLIVLLVLILFGHSKIPDMMKNLAGGLKVFKKEMKDDKAAADVKSVKATTKKSAATKSVAKKKTAKKSSKK